MIRCFWAMAVVTLAATALRAGEPMAHDPQYDNREVWPAWVEKTDFSQEQWPKGRVLVWRLTSGRVRVDMSDPAHWLEEGKPATRPPDEQTDIVLPSPPNGKKYHVSGKQGCTARHMTVQAGVSSFLKSIVIHGNLWIKKGSFFHAIQPRGAKNTFMRNDDPEPNKIANKIAFNKPPDRSTEWIGGWKTGDELDLFSGTFIVGPDSTFMPGDRSTQHVYPNAKLVLLSGATFHKRGNQYHLHDVEIEGAVLAGTPARPLTKDAVLGLSFKAKGKGDAHHSRPGDKGLILYRPGRIAVHSTDPEKARLVFKWHRMPVQSFGFKGEGEPAEIKVMPHGIDFVLLGRTDFNGVEFQDTLAGGIRMPDPSARENWKHVTFGKGNFAQPAELFAGYEGDLNAEMKDTGVAAGLAKEADAKRKNE